MKKTPLKRKTALQSKTQLKTKTPLKAKTPLRAKSNLNAVSEKIQKMPLRQQPIKKTTNPKSKRKYGLVGHGRKQEHIQHHSRLVKLGCFACNHLGTVPTTKLCIHHVRGRNKGREGDVSEWLVICLCWLHHDPTTIGGALDAPSVHGNKRLFKEQIGSEMWCVHESFRLAGTAPPWLLDDDAWQTYQSINDREAAEQWLVQFEKTNGGYSLSF